MAISNSSRFTLKEGIEAAIQEYLKDYSDEVVQVTEQVVKDIAVDSVQKLKAESPKRKGKSKHQYSKGWTYKIDNTRLRAGAVIYGKKGTYNLAHLLEYGHATRNGGRDTRAIAHIKPVETWAIKEFQDRLVRALS